MSYVNNDWILLDCDLKMEEYYAIEQFLRKTYLKKCPRKVKFVNRLMEIWSGREGELLRKFRDKYKLLRSDIPWSVRQFMKRPPKKEPSPEPVPPEVEEAERERALRDHFADLHRNFLRIRKKRPRKNPPPRHVVPINPFARPQRQRSFGTPEKRFKRTNSVWSDDGANGKDVGNKWITFNNITTISPHILIGDRWTFRGHFGRRPDFLKIEFETPAGDVALSLVFGSRFVTASSSIGGRYAVGKPRNFDTDFLKGKPSVNHCLGHYEKFFIRLFVKKRGYVITIRSTDKRDGRSASLRYAHRLGLEGIQKLRVIKCDTRTNVYSWELRRRRKVALERQEREELDHHQQENIRRRHKPTI